MAVTRLILISLLSWVALQAPLAAQSPIEAKYRADLPMVLVRIATDRGLTELRIGCAAGSPPLPEMLHYQQSAVRRIEESARSQNIDLTRFRGHHFRLLTERIVAHARNDKAAVLRAEALLASNIEIGLQEVSGRQKEVKRGYSVDPGLSNDIDGGSATLGDACLEVLKEAVVRRANSMHFYTAMQPGRAFDEWGEIIAAAGKSFSTYVNVAGTTKNLTCFLAIDAGYVYGARNLQQRIAPELSDAALVESAIDCYTAKAEVSSRTALTAGARIAQMHAKMSSSAKP